MKVSKIKIPLIIYILIQNGCGIYSFTGASIPAGTETFQVNYFENKAGNRPGSTVEPGLDRDFTIALQDLILNRTNLSLVNKEGDLIYEGEITEYSVTPYVCNCGNKSCSKQIKNKYFFKIL